MSEKRKIPMQLREAEVCEFETRGEGGDRPRLVFSLSSEAPVERFYGMEILSHEAGAVRMDRLNRRAMPLLFNHDPDDPVGMVDSGRLENGRLMVEAHMFDTARAREVEAMLAGGLRNVSVGYRIHNADEDRKTGEFRVTDWEPHEASVVTIPADASVGFGRSGMQEFDVQIRSINTATSAGGKQMTEKVPATAGESAEETTASNPVEFEKLRKESIRKLCKANRLDERYERSWIESGADLNQVADDLLQILQERAKSNPESEAKLDLSANETRRYSLMRALRAATNKDWKNAGLELECNKEISKRLNQLPKSDTSFFVPLDILMRDLPRSGRRDLLVGGSPINGGNLVGTDFQPQNFIELLRNTSVALRMGVQRLSGLRGNVTIPKMTAGNTAYWLSDETTQITESQPTIGQLSLSPHNVAALTELSHQLMQQATPDAETLVLSSIARDIGLAVDIGVLRGSGASGQPQGIVGTSGVGAVTGTNLAAAGIIEFQTDVAGSNALMPGCGYVTTPAVAGLLMARPKLPTTGTTPLWEGNVLEGNLFGFPAMASNQMASATALFGWWPSVILAEWGVLELMVNPYSDFTRGLTAVRGWYTCDVGVRYAGAFSYASSIT